MGIGNGGPYPIRQLFPADFARQVFAKDDSYSQSISLRDKILVSSGLHHLPVIGTGELLAGTNEGAASDFRPERCVLWTQKLFNRCRIKVDHGDRDDLLWIIQLLKVAEFVRCMTTSQFQYDIIDAIDFGLPNLLTAR